ncbi:hypothetical protein [Streptomyces sp. NPDC088725]|uniref:hypothetical protein n=1 Tax=Streptomyces sp. NPDC088725 TaxID=3365873 RepID=UPI0038245C5B
MNSERAHRLVTALRARRVMAHVAEVGVYEFGIRVVINEDAEALWDTDGAAGLDAEVLSNGVLIGYVPHVAGSEDFTEEQIVDCIAAADYSAGDLHPRSGAGPSDSAVPLPDVPVLPRPKPGRRWWRR